MFLMPFFPCLRSWERKYIIFWIFCTLVPRPSGGEQKQVLRDFFTSMLPRPEGGDAKGLIILRAVYSTKKVQVMGASSTVPAP